MLNISPNSINLRVDRRIYASLRLVESRRSGKVFIRLLTVLSFLALIVIFLPWTQNVRTRGNVTTIRPDQRPQTIHSVIAGRIEKWFVKEGDFVNKGDSILFISEIKDSYFDPNLLGRTEEQLKSRVMSVSSYMEKVKALDNQISALTEAGKLKFQQLQNKLQQSKLNVTSDSIGYEVKRVNYDIAVEQYDRMDKLYNEGLKSKTDLENRRLAKRKAQAEMTSAENKLLESKNEVINAEMQLILNQAQYKDKINKAESEKYTALSNMYDAEAVVTKLQNQYMNYAIRSGLYFITAPQDGYVTKAIQSGIGETIKEGEPIVSIMPASYDLMVQMYVRPIDLPLLEKGQQVRIQFDGWPAVIFSGWPNTSYGTYGGSVLAIDNFISDNGMYRVLVEPDTTDYLWPEALRVGAGTTNILLLKDVPVWYELWRKINGFPPDYYSTNKNKVIRSK